MDGSKALGGALFVANVVDALLMRNASHSILRNLPPRWASAYGEDKRGILVEFEVNSVTFELRWIQPGSFKMGSPESEKGRHSDEGPQHEVTLSQGFWAGATPVTQEQWEAVMGVGNNPSKFKGPDHPVDSVSWEDCQKYLTDLRELLPGLVADLPTEAQWEYVCRAGTESAYAWGDNWSEGQANMENDEGTAEDKQVEYFEGEGVPISSTSPVRTFAPNGWGLYDMHGNAWECVGVVSGRASGIL